MTVRGVPVALLLAVGAGRGTRPAAASFGYFAGLQEQSAFDQMYPSGQIILSTHRLGSAGWQSSEQSTIPHGSSG